ncbi:MAG: DUF3365 domain-containing protein [Planctomycetes bacterium]|nr:DUF3365 domain-containing protein [Planctomycetota bacterium]
MTNEPTRASRTIGRSCCLTALAIVVSLAGGCSRVDGQDAELEREILAAYQPTVAEAAKRRKAHRRTLFRPESWRLRRRSLAARNRAEVFQIRDSAESLKAATERARREQQRAACRGTVATALTALHWEVFAESAAEKKMVRRMTDAFRSKPVEWTFISAHRQANDPPLDEFETELLKRFAKSPSAKSEQGGHPLFAERRSPVDGRYEYYQPSFYKHDCFVCHNRAGGPTLSVIGGGLSEPDPYREGDLIAIVKIRRKE